MSQKTFTCKLPSSDGVSTLVCKVSLPDNVEASPPRGIVQIVHGMCEHMGRYKRFMEFLTQQGFLVCGHDHIGHGESCKSKEMLGYFGEENGYKFLVEDAHLVSEALIREYPGVPLFLFGHSMGSMISRLYLSKHSDILSGVILCGTAGANPASRSALACCRAVIRKKGPLYRPKLLDRLIFGSYNHRFPHARTENDWLSRDPAVVDLYMADPKCSFLFTACGYRDLLSLLYYCNTPAWYQTLSLNLPCLLISGSMDPVGDYGKGVRHIYQKMKKAGVSDLSLRLYPEARHELLNEINYMQVQRDCLFWLETRLGK